MDNAYINASDFYVNERDFTCIQTQIESLSMILYSLIVCPFVVVAKFTGKSGMMTGKAFVISFQLLSDGHCSTFYKI